MSYKKIYTEEEIYDLLKKWVNHTKEGHPRLEINLIIFDKLWEFIKELLINLEAKSNPTEDECDFIKSVKYVGPLSRVHLKYDDFNPTYGIKESAHYHSWTKSQDITDIYWVYSTTDCIVIESQATPDLFGIDLVGLSNFIGFHLGSPAILKEKEVVFPLLMHTVTNIRKNIQSKTPIESL